MYDYNDAYYRRLKTEVLSKLGKPKTKTNEVFTGPFDCPFCGKKDKGYCHSNRPARFFCNNASCSAYKDNKGESMAELLGFSYDFDAEHKKNETPKDDIWKSYLRSRGLKKVISGLKAAHWDNIRKSGKGGVLFDVGKNIEGKEIKTGRIYNPSDKNKSHTTGKLTGCIFKHHSREHNSNDPIYLVEGPLNCLSLEEMGFNSIAVISTNQSVEAISHHLETYKNIVLSFDNDESGIYCCRKYLDKFPDSEVVLLGEGEDHNDLLCHAGSGEEARKVFVGHYERYKQNGKLALSTTAWEYGTLRHEYFKKLGLFTFSGATYFCEIRTKGLEAPTVKTEGVGGFTLSVITKIKMEATLNSEYQYRLKIKPIDSIEKDVVATFKDLESQRSFNSFLIKTCMCTFKGSKNAMDAISELITTHTAPVSRKCLLLGLDRTSGVWVSKDFAIAKDGSLHTPTKDNLFKIQGKEQLAPSENANAEEVISPSLTPKHSIKDIYRLFNDAYPVFGAIGWAWFIGSIFINEIKSKYNQYPFLSIAGTADTGKSCFVSELQLFQGWANEGRDISPASSNKGLSRELYGLSGGFRAILEVTHETEKLISKFINILGAFNRGGGAVKAMMTNDNSVNNSILRCGLLFCANAEIWKNKQEKSRSVSLKFTDECKTSKTFSAYRELQKISKEDKAAVHVEILKRRENFLSLLDGEIATAKADLEAVSLGRVLDNYSTILGLHRSFCKLFDIDQDSLDQDLEKLALEKLEDCQKLATNPASIFFELIQSTKSSEVSKFWVEIKDITKRNYGTIYISIPELINALNRVDSRPPDQTLIQNHILDHPAYVGHGSAYNFFIGFDENKNKKFVRRKCWRLNADKFRATENLDMDFSVILEP